MTVPRHRASTSAPLHSSVTATGTRGMPTSAAAKTASKRVSGSSTFLAVQSRRNSAKKPRLEATLRSANLTASDRPWRVTICPGDPLHADMLRSEGAAQLVDRFETPEPCRAGKNINVHGPRFGPGVEDSVRLAEDQHDGEA